MSVTVADIGNEIKVSYQPSANEDLPYIGLEHVEPNSLHLSSYGSSTEVKSTKYKYLKGDILFGTLRPYFKKLVIAPFGGVCSTEFCVIRPKNERERHFLFYLLAQDVFIEYATKNSVGARPRTKWSLFSDFGIRDFSPSEKHEIGRYLLNYDYLIENNRRRIQLLEESARLLYKEWFVQLRYPGHEHVKIIDGVPEGWAKRPIKEVLTLNYGKALQADLREPGEYPVYGSSGVVGSHNKPLIKAPGIIVGRKGNVGSIFWVSKDYWPIDTVYFVNPEESSLYLYHALQKVTFINTDVAVPGLNRDMAYSREILIPADNVLSLFHDEVEPIQRQIEKLGEYNNKLSEARDILLPRLMNGALVV